MGGAAEQQLTEAIEALVTRDRERARWVVSSDAKLDLLQRDIEQKAITTIAVRQPLAADLREIVAMLRMANDLERIGDLAKNIGKRVAGMNGAPMPARAMRGFRHMVELTLCQLHDVLDAFAERDLRKAVTAWKKDKEIDSLYASLFGEIMTHMREDPGTLTFGVNFVFCAKNIERIGDHTTNIAEAIHYMVEGGTWMFDRAKVEATGAVEHLFEFA
jgi:phosphate transport system protein